MKRLERYQGSLMGLATGDALGAQSEFKFRIVSDLIGGGVFGLKPGQWTDDTSMALCLAKSLISCQGFDPKDQLDRYLKWYRHGYLSSTGLCFDIGGTTRRALEVYEATGNVAAPYSEKAAGNGCIMRLAPVPLAFAHNPEQAVFWSGESCLTTHNNDIAVEATRYFGALLTAAVNGVSKEKLDTKARLWTGPLSDRLESALEQWSSKNTTGYVLDTLATALWVFYTTDDFEEGVLTAVNLGGDTDTIGAVYGQLAGAYYGIDAIPARWRRKIYWNHKILTLAEQLLVTSRRLALTEVGPTRHNIDLRRGRASRLS